MDNKQLLERAYRNGYPYMTTMVLDNKPMSAIKPVVPIDMTNVDFKRYCFTEPTMAAAQSQESTHNECD